MLKRKSKALADGVAWSRRWLAHGLMTVQEQAQYEHEFGPLPALLSARAMRRARRRAAADEIEIARAFNCGSHHVREWEEGRSHPRGPELKLIHLAGKRGVHIVSQGATP